MRANPPGANGAVNGKSGASTSLSRTSTPLSISSSSLSEPSEEEKPNIKSEIKIEVTPAEDGDVTMNGTFWQVVQSLPKLRLIGLAKR